MKTFLSVKYKPWFSWNFKAKASEFSTNRDDLIYSYRCVKVVWKLDKIVVISQNSILSGFIALSIASRSQTLHYIWRYCYLTYYSKNETIRGSYGPHQIEFTKMISKRFSHFIHQSLFVFAFPCKHIFKS